VLGGCTAINAGLFFQPPASDFDTYFPKDWKSADVADAIAKVRAKQPFTDNPSQDGKRYLQSGYEVAKEWLVDGAGYDEVGINDAADSKSKVFGHPVYNYEGGQRSGPVKTYLQSALDRPNFSLLTGARVTRVVRDGEVATAVTVSGKNGTETNYSVCSGGRIILSGGALASPQLLMVSGIGDPEALTNLTNNGVLSISPDEWINNTAVGDKLFDNPNTFIELTSPNVTSYEYSYDNPPTADKELYLTKRSGPYSFGSQTSAFWDMIPSGNGTIGCQGTIDSSGALEFTANNTITLNVYGTSGLHSMGKVVLDERGLAGASMTFYTDKRDAIAVATFIHDIFAALPASLTPHPIARNSTLEELTTWVSTWSQYTMGNVLHWSSSCRFETCVDTNAQVLGMQNLHVVDASIVPPLTTNPVFGIMAAAERASELILALDGY
jgi:cellobiose dehydrogenase (acceptor)